MAIRDRTIVGEVAAVAGGTNVQVRLVRVVEESTGSGVTEKFRETHRFTVDREMPEHGAPEDGWPTPMERLDRMMESVPENWLPLDDDDRAHIRRMAQAAWGLD